MLKRFWQRREIVVGRVELPARREAPYATWQGAQAVVADEDGVQAGKVTEGLGQMCDEVVAQVDVLHKMGQCVDDYGSARGMVQVVCTKETRACILAGVQSDVLHQAELPWLPFGRRALLRNSWTPEPEGTAARAGIGWVSSQQKVLC